MLAIFRKKVTRINYIIEMNSAERRREENIRRNIDFQIAVKTLLRYIGFYEGTILTLNYQMIIASDGEKNDTAQQKSSKLCEREHITEKETEKNRKNSKYFVESNPTVEIIAKKFQSVSRILKTTLTRGL